MQGNTRSHKPHFGLSWDSANVTLTILVMLFFLIFLFLFLTLTSPAAQGQNSAPRTAAHLTSMEAGRCG